MEVTYGSGTRVVFQKNTDGTFKIPYGVTDTLTQDANGYALTRKDQSAYSYDVTGKLQSIADRYGNNITLAYNSGKISTVTDPAGRQLTFTYNNEGLLWKVTDPLNRTVEYSYDVNGNLAWVLDLEGKKTTYSYYDNIQTVTDQQSGTTTQQFIGSRIKQIIDANDHQVIKNDYDVYGRVVRQYDGNGNIKYQIYKDICTDSEYEIVGTSELARYYIDENGNESKVTFNPVTKLPVVETDALGKTVQHSNYIYIYGSGQYGQGTWKDITNVQAPLDPAETETPEYQEYLNAVNHGNRNAREVITGFTLFRFRSSNIPVLTI